MYIPYNIITIITIIIIIIDIIIITTIIIYSSTVRVAGAPLMISQTTSFLHFSLLTTALWDLANSRPVHSLMLSSHPFFCLPCLININ